MYFMYINVEILFLFDFQGFCFKNITPLLLNPKSFKDTIDPFVERYKDKNIELVAGKL